MVKYVANTTIKINTLQKSPIFFSEGLSGVSHYYWAEFTVSLSKHVGTTPRLLIYTP